LLGNSTVSPLGLVQQVLWFLPLCRLTCWHSVKRWEGITGSCSATRQCRHRVSTTGLLVPSSCRLTFGTASTLPLPRLHTRNFRLLPLPPLLQHQLQIPITTGRGRQHVAIGVVVCFRPDGSPSLSCWTCTWQRMVSRRANLEVRPHSFLHCR
jgi:hypothetical protein